MKKNLNGKSKPKKADLLPEYKLDYSKAKPNRFAARYQEGSRLIMLDPDIAQVFTSAESVNKALRALLKVMPKP